MYWYKACVFFLLFFSFFLFIFHLFFILSLFIFYLFFIICYFLYFSFTFFLFFFYFFFTFFWVDWLTYAETVALNTLQFHIILYMILHKRSSLALNSSKSTLSHPLWLWIQYQCCYHETFLTKSIWRVWSTHLSVTNPAL